MSQFMLTPKKPILPPTPMSYCNTSLPPLSSILKKDSVIPPMTPSGIARLPSIDSFTTPVSDKKLQFQHYQQQQQQPSYHSSTSLSSLYQTPTIPAMQKHHSTPNLSVVTSTPSKNGNNVKDTSFSLPNSSMDTSESDITPNDSVVQSKVSSPIESKAYAFISHSPATFPNQEPSIDNAPLARRKRRRTSPNELSILNKEFDFGSTPNKARRVEISKKVHMTEKAVQIWFQNKRQALRKHSTVEKEVTELPQVAEPSIITSTPIKPQLTKSHSFATTLNTDILDNNTNINASPILKRSHSASSLYSFDKKETNELVNISRKNSATDITSSPTKIKEEDPNNLVLNETKKKQPNFLNVGKASTMTFKLAPAKVKSPKREERKPLGEINVNRINVNVKLENAKMIHEKECVQNLLSLRAANWN